MMDRSRSSAASTSPSKKPSTLSTEKSTRPPTSKSLTALSCPRARNLMRLMRLGIRISVQPTNGKANTSVVWPKQKKGSSLARFRAILVTMPSMASSRLPRTFTTSSSRPSTGSQLAQPRYQWTCREIIRTRFSTPAAHAITSWAQIMPSLRAVAIQTRWSNNCRAIISTLKCSKPSTSNNAASSTASTWTWRPEHSDGRSNSVSFIFQFITVFFNSRRTDPRTRPKS